MTWAIMNAPRLLSKEVRQGFSYAFPYDDVLNVVYKGLPKRSGPIADSVRGYDPDVFLYQTDLDKAKELILSGGFKEGDVFEYMVDANEETEQTVAQLFQANVQKMGFNLELTSVDYATVESTVYGDSPPEERPHFISGWGWWPDYNDPWNQLWPNFTEANIGGGGSNGGAWVNERFEEIMAEAEHFETRGAARRTDEGSPKHPDRAGSARDLLRAAGRLHSSWCRHSRVRPEPPVPPSLQCLLQCRGLPPDPAAVG